MLVAHLLAAAADLRVTGSEVSKWLIASMLMNSTSMSEVVGLLSETLAGVSKPPVRVLPTRMQTCPRCILMMISLVGGPNLWLPDNPRRLLWLLHELKALSILHGGLVLDGLLVLLVVEGH